MPNPKGLYEDKNGKFWIWDEYLEANIAVREPNREAALLAAIKSLQFYCKMYKESRDELRVKMTKVENCFEEVFGGQDDD